MRLKLLISIASLAVLASGCMSTTQITEPDGSMYTIKSGTDSLVVMKGRDWEATIDNRGKPNIFQSVAEWMVLQTPDVIKAQ